MSEPFPNGSAVLVQVWMASIITRAAVRVLGDSKHANILGVAARKRVEENFWKNTSSPEQQAPVAFLR